MFQTFTGSSRRPRQVNLSGQNPNPFATNSWGSASATQKTVAGAQQERQQRQLERERLNASKQIQRTWRGHKVRSDLANSQRAVWDAVASAPDAADYATMIEQLRFLVLFYNPSQQKDRQRLQNLTTRIQNSNSAALLKDRQVQSKLPKLAGIILSALHSSPDSAQRLIELLVGIICQQPLSFPSISQQYFIYLSSILSSPVINQIDQTVFIKAIQVPLTRQPPKETSAEYSLITYTKLALHFLTTPDLVKHIGSLEPLEAFIDLKLLSSALMTVFSNSRSIDLLADSRLWLLAHFIGLSRTQSRRAEDSVYIKALCLQLSYSSDEVIARMSVDHDINMQDEDHDTVASQPLPQYIRQQLLQLVEKDNILGILQRFNVGQTSIKVAGEDEASLVASYVLILLRIFPARGDELRMWLHLGSVPSSTPGASIRALKFFWHSISKSMIYAQIKADSKAALRLLREQSSISPIDIAKDREWRTILLFLELYAFVLRFTDDEEFFSPGRFTIAGDQLPVSRTRDSALPLEDVKELTLFLKNISFTVYYNAGELTDETHSTLSGGLGSYFGTTSTAPSRALEFARQADLPSKRPFAGIAGMDFDYVRTLASGVMRMLYERDSRRHFLPKGHWLMTSRFDMEGFIPAVVMEEEKRHEVPDEEDDAEENHTEFSFQFGENRSGLVGMGRGRRNQQIEALRKVQQQAARQKVLASVGPRLEVLQNMPFVIPFETRVQIFRQFVFLDQMRRRNGNVDPDIWRMSVIQQHMSTRRGQELLGRHHAKIRRDQLFEDAFDQFYSLGDGLKEPIQITFVDKFDTVEAGIDGGGVTKEFLTSVTNEAFHAGQGSLFVTNDQNLLYPNPTALDERRVLLRQAGLTEADHEWQDAIRDLLNHYEFLGRVVGKCLYEGILIDIGFAAFFLLKWAATGSTGEGYKASINDLRDLDESLYQGLLQVKNYPGNVEDLSLDFTITDTVSLPGSPTVALTRELVPNGSNVPVTNENRPLYVSYVARHRLQYQPYLQTQAFLKGLGTIIKPSWLSMFNQSELQTLIGGESSQIDVADLRSNTLYGGVYVIGDDGEEHDTVKLFWQVMNELDDVDRRKVLKYVTSTPRAPLLGFEQLNPRFSIRDAGSDESRLPSTSTCVNLLKLPRYKTKRTLREKLLYAVNSGAGFDLS